jgi:hypothetical protein
MTIEQSRVAEPGDPAHVVDEAIRALGAAGHARITIRDLAWVLDRVDRSRAWLAQQLKRLVTDGTLQRAGVGVYRIPNANVAPDPSATVLWVDIQPGLWRSLDGRYVILHAVLPEDRPEPTETYTLRHLDRQMAAAYPGTLGSFVAEAYSLHAAQQEAERHAWERAQGGACHVPADFPALRLERFFWPISEGTSRAALAIVRENGRVLARVVGMSRGDADAYEPGTYAEIDLTGLLTDQPESGF